MGVIDPKILTTLPDGRVGQSYVGQVDVNLTLQEGDVFAGVTLIYPTPNWVQVVFTVGDPGEGVLDFTSVGTPNLDGDFEIRVSGDFGPGGLRTFEMEAGGPLMVRILQADVNPIATHEAIVGSKVYVLEPTQKIAVSVDRGSGYTIDPDMEFTNDDPGQSIQIAINEGGRLVGFPAEITSVGNADAYLNEPYEYDGVSAPSAPTVTGTLPVRFSLVSAPEPGFSMHPTSGAISWIPTEDGLFPVKYRASNVAGKDEEEINITVHIIPTAITSVLPDDVPNGEAYSQQMAADGSPALTWSGGISPADATFHVSPTGMLTWEPNVLVETPYEITVSVTGPGGTDEQISSVTVIILS